MHPNKPIYLLLVLVQFCFSSNIPDLNIEALSLVNIEISSDTISGPKYGCLNKTLKKYTRGAQAFNMPSKVSALEWEKTYDLYSLQLIDQAEEEGLPFKSLEKSLKKILKDAQKRGIIYIPIRAIYTHKEKKPVWIVVIKWEYKGYKNFMRKEYPDKDPMDFTLGHIRFFAYTVKSKRLVGFSTCM